MKKIKYYILFLVFFLAISACNKDFLERTPGADLTEEKIFSDPTLAMNYADNAYNHLIDEYARFNAHRGTTSQASDEAVSGTMDISVRTLNQGLFHDHYERGGASLNDIGDVWKRAYAGIRIANVMLSKMSTIPWGSTSVERIERINGEMHFIRAFLYFELIKRFGGVPLVDKPAFIFDDIDIPRNTYQECVDFILRDLQAADGFLKTEYSASEYGRATKGAARALKSRLLLYAASARNNESNDLEKWRLAKEAATAVINMPGNTYGLQGTYSDILNLPNSSEYIMIKIRGPRPLDGFLQDFVMSPGSGGAQGSMNPTQNHVDMYQMAATGLPITDPASGYDPQKPYEGRDPRLKANVLVNDADWQGRKMGMWTQTALNGIETYGADFRPNNIIYSATRYYCRKMWPEVYRNPTTQRALLNYVFFRYAEVLLNYAEASNEFNNNPQADPNIRTYVNLIRSRVGMPGIATNLDKDQMREAIRHERAVELAFEDHRWYDLLRWKKAKEVLTQTMKGMNVVKNLDGTFTYNVVDLPSTYQKKFEDHMYYYPIPRNEIFKSKGILVQNQEW